MALMPVLGRETGHGARRIRTAARVARVGAVIGATLLPRVRSRVAPARC